MPVPFSSALYYPYIDIRNENWLRIAALFGILSARLFPSRIEILTQASSLEN